MKKLKATLILTTIFLSSIVTSKTVAQDVNKARELLKQALAALEPVTLISTPEALDQALAGEEMSLTLSPTLIYPSTLTIRRPVTIQSIVPPGRIDSSIPLPKFTNGLVIPSNSVFLTGIETTQQNSNGTIVTFSGGDIVLDRVRVLGSQINGARHCIVPNGNGNNQIINSYVDYCFGPYPGNDTQAILAWDMAPGLLIENSYLSGGTETIMFGGADSSTPERMPSKIIIRGNDITKRLEWLNQLVSVKNTFELKVGSDIVVENNNISYSWGGHGQDGYIVAFTVRNQDGRAPWSTIKNITFQNNTLSSGAGAFNLLGSDNNNPSVMMTNVVIKGNTVTDIDPVKYKGSSRMILVSGGTKEVNLDNNTFVGVGVASTMYFYGPIPKNINDFMQFTNNTLPISKYGVFGENSSVAKPGQVPPPAFVRYTTNGTYTNNVVK